MFSLLHRPEPEEEEAKAEGDKVRMLCTRRAAVGSVSVLCVVKMEKSCGASACQAKCAKSRCLTLTQFRPLFSCIYLSPCHVVAIMNNVMVY